MQEQPINDNCLAVKEISIYFFNEEKILIESNSKESLIYSYYKIYLSFQKSMYACQRCVGIVIFTASILFSINIFVNLINTNIKNFGFFLHFVLSYLHFA